MNKKLRFMWMLLLTFVCSAIWAEKYDYNKDDEYSKVSFAATTDASETNVLTKGGITLTRSKGTWESITPDGAVATCWEFEPGTTITITGSDIVYIPMMFTGIQWGDPEPFTYTDVPGQDFIGGFKNNWNWQSQTERPIPASHLPFRPNAALTYIIREGNKAINVTSNNADVSFKIGATLNGTIKGDVNYNGGFVNVAVTEGDFSSNHDGSYEQRPITIQPSLIADYPGDLVRIENLTASVANGVYKAVVKDGQVNYTFEITNGADFGLKHGQEYDMNLWYYAPGANGCAATTRVTEALIHYAAPAAPTIEGDEYFTDYTTIKMSSEPGTTIHYTLDGSNPTTLSPLYTKPFIITETTTVKALAERDELASVMVEKTFTKRPAVEWQETTIEEAIAGKKDIPYAILKLNRAIAPFTANYGKSWIIRDGESALHWTTKQSLAMNYEYYGTVRVKIDYNNGFLQAYDIEGETNMDDITVINHFGDFDYHFTTAYWDEIENGEHKGDFIMLKRVKVVKETDEDGIAYFYAGEGDNRIALDNSKGFAYYWKEDPKEYHDVGGWYRGERDMFVAKLRLSVGTPEIQGDEVFVNSTKVSIVPDNEADEIYYTLDGSDPDKDAEETLYYVSPITISRTTVVRAIAYRYDGVSDIAEKTFTKTTDDGIDAATVNGEDANLTRYNLAGQRVGKNYKGIVIENGHKVVRK